MRHCDRHLIIRAFCLCLAAQLCIGAAAYSQSNVFDWAKQAEVWDSVKLAQLSIKEPRALQIHCLQIDLANPRIRFFTTPRCDDWTEDAQETKRQTTRDFLVESRSRRSLNMIAAVNAAPWTPWPAPCSEESMVNVSGLLVSDGTLVSPADGRPAFKIFSDGLPAIAAAPQGMPVEGIQMAVSGFSHVLKDGVAQSGGETLEPRTGFGLSEDKRYVLLMIIDGRSGLSRGATTGETGQWLLHFGAHDGLNMDGGGSSTMVIWTEEDTPKIVNTPVGCGRRMTERAVGANIGVYLVTETATIESRGTAG